MTASESTEIKLLASHIESNNKRLAWFIGLAVGVLLTLIGWILINSNKEAQFRGQVLTEIRSINDNVGEMRIAIRNNNLSIQDINNELIKSNNFEPTSRGYN